ncbi:Pimeloyl-ACP methyl ester carboxylesterase [Gillisia sp. Hel1_33_143]|uniref:alpha/beta fold hydrolase n=1 Tax=Gillisia sp. Hel1_33_143 TaxID=1336796 RepID=UPI000879CC6C|nr:alpha/beta fold hydrolase [Gillisia sp. Hel1_33_143]SDR71028.1 Pimeloyl-ACP methyl ester carboxylesterase [Gillisia sp. Hel1_33_143]
MIDLKSTIIGEGQPLIILHGFLGMSDNWKTLGGKFAEQGYQVHLLDQRNHGRSPHTEEMSYRVMAQDLKEYCEKNDLKNIILLGHSMGGKVAMRAAGEYPDLIEKVIIVDIGPKYYAPHHQEILGGLDALSNQVLTSRGDAEDFLETYIKDKGTRLFLLKNLYWKTKEKLALRMNLEVLKDASEEIGEALPAGIRFKKQTLFIKGERSNYITSEDEPLISLHFPNNEIVVIAKAGHWVHAENMKDFYANVMRFLQP